MAPEVYSDELMVVLVYFWEILMLGISDSSSN